MNNIAVLYCSCYMYRNLWKPFLAFREKYIPLNGIPWYIGTDGSESDIRAIVGDSMTVLGYPERADNSKNYIKRILFYLDRIPSEYILFWYDDMYPTGPVKVDLLQTSLELLRETPSAQLVKLSNHSHPFHGGTYTFKGVQYQKASQNNHYIMNTQPTLFRKSFFKAMCEYIDSNPNATDGPSSLELIGTDYAQKYSSNLYLRTEADCSPMLHFGGVVRSGVVEPSAKAFLEREGIPIELYKNNCIYDTEDKENTKTLNQHLKWQLSEYYRIHV